MAERAPLAALPPRAVRVLRVGAFVYGAALAVALAWLTDLSFLGTRPGGPAFVDAARAPSAVAFAVGALTSLVWPIGAAVIAAVGGASLGVFAAGQLDTPWATVMIAAFALPALVWGLLGVNARRPRFAFVATGGLVAAVVVATAVATDRYDAIYGPTHPASIAVELPPSALRWVWSGAVTDTSATVVAKLAEAPRSTTARLAISEHADLTSPTYTQPAAVDPQRVVRFDVEDLRPNTTYHYAVEVDGELDRTRAGRFRTFGNGARSFTVAFGGCARVGSNGAVFDAIRALDPALFLILGDWHYGNVDDDDPGSFREVADIALEAPGPSALYRSTPLAYVWDDHDYGGNNADAGSKSRDAAMDVYRQYVPHYPLAGDDAPIYQAFTIGRVRFLVTDARAARDDAGDEDDERKSMLGDEQKAWLERELLAARDTAALVVWVNPVPWVDDAGEGKDTWGGYSTERRELADFIAESDIDNLVMISGDAHMVAIDDGTNTDYTTDGDDGFPLLHVAPLDRRGRVKGGPYSQGPIAKGGQFGVLEVTDDGGPLTVALTARDWRGETLLRHEFQVTAGG